jgi:hypothetical protein
MLRFQLRDPSPKENHRLMRLCLHQLTHKQHQVKVIFHPHGAVIWLAKSEYRRSKPESNQCGILS